MLKKNKTKYIATKNQASIADFQLYFSMTDAILFKIPLDNFSRLKKWMKVCENTKGIKEVHKEWLETTLPKLEAMMK